MWLDDSNRIQKSHLRVVSFSLGIAHTTFDPLYKQMMWAQMQSYTLINN